MRYRRVGLAVAVWSSPYFGVGAERAPYDATSVIRRLIGPDAVQAAEQIQTALSHLKRDSRRRGPELLDLLVLRAREQETAQALDVAALSPPGDGAAVDTPPVVALDAVFARWCWGFATATYGFAYLKALGLLGGVVPASMEEARKLDTLAFRERCGAEAKLVHFHRGPAMGTVKSPCYLVAYSESRNAVVLAVRGTADPGDAITDLACVADSYDGLKYHSGILAAAFAVLNDASEAILAVVDEARPSKLVVTGHSLGGGVALCIALLLDRAADDAAESIEGASNGSAWTGDRGDYAGDKDGAVLLLARRLAAAGMTVETVAFSPPPVACDADGSHLDVAQCCSISVGDDVVPYLSLHSVKKLQKQLDRVDAEMTPADRLKLVAASAAQRSGVLRTGVLRTFAEASQLAGLLPFPEKAAPPPPPAQDDDEGANGDECVSSLCRTLD